MCHQCNYSQLLSRAKLEVTNNRVDVLQVVGNYGSPLSADDIHKILQQRSKINRVTVYRILDLLVDCDVVERLSTGGRAFCYGLAPNHNHPRHPHFYCNRCGRMDCLNPANLPDTSLLWKNCPGQIDKVEIRIDGICKNCLQNEQE